MLARSCLFYLFAFISVLLARNFVLGLFELYLVFLSNICSVFRNPFSLEIVLMNRAS